MSARRVVVHSTAINGTEQRLDAVLAELAALREAVERIASRDEPQPDDTPAAPAPKRKRGAA